MNNDEYMNRTLTQIAAALQIAHAKAIETVRTELMEDKANKEIFNTASSWTTTAELEKAVVTNSKAASRATLYRRLSDFADRGLLERRGAASKTEYRNSGLI